MMNPTHERVLITGGTSGIGRAMALELAEAGARVVVCGSDADRARACAELHPRIMSVSCDVTESADVAALRTVVDTRLGGLDMLVHAAALQQEIDFVEGADPGCIVREVAVNLTAPMLVTLALLPTLARGVNPTVVAVTSILAAAPKQSAPVYCATKAGLRSWTTALRYQLESHGVRVVELIPPLVRTRMTVGRDEGAVEPEDVARAFMRGVAAGRDVVRVGKARSARVVERLAPAVLARVLRAG